MPGVMPLRLQVLNLYHSLIAPKRFMSKFPVTRLLKYSLIALIVLVLCSPLLYVANDWRLKNKYERGMNQILVGDSKEAVITLMGEPDSRNWCYPSPTDHDTPERKRFHERCVDEYQYDIFLTSYVVTFDKDSRVSGKNKMVSP